MLRDWQSRFVAQLRALPSAPLPADGFLGSQAHRFAVYRDNMIGSLVEALGETFPVTRQLVGGRFFDPVAADFVRRDPPTAPRLSRYGGRFPGFLGELPQLRDLAYAVDVAQLEWARVESYFAGIAETVLEPDALLALPPEVLPALRLVAVPSLRVVSTATSSQSIWLAHQGREPAFGEIDPWRHEAVRLVCAVQGVRADRIAPAHAVFLQGLMAGQDLTQAFSAAATVDPNFDLQGALVAEMQIGSFGAIGLPAAG
ncbi:MAG TPA: DNA-binding domain-containing protein [Terriglobia bacterium]|nr:DNA-binding domain-containing protein [Terriglobia bacterium]